MSKRLWNLSHSADEVVITDEIEVMFHSKAIKELTMNKIHADALTSSRSKTNIGKGMIALIAAAVCLALCGAGYASGLFSQTYNWQGEAIGAPQPLETVGPQEMIVLNQSDAYDIQSILDDRTDRELVIVQEKGGDHSSLRSESIRSLEELKEKLAAENSPLCAPCCVPNEYVLKNGLVGYDSTDGYTLVSSEQQTDGRTVSRFISARESDFISYFRLDCENAAGDRLFLFARMSQKADYNFSAVNGEAMEAVQVKDMDEALLRVGTESTSLSMLQYLEIPIIYKDPFSTIGYKDSDPYTEIYYLCYATGIDGATLMEMFQQ